MSLVVAKVELCKGGVEASASATAHPPSSPRPFRPRWSDVSGVQRRSVSATASLISQVIVVKVERRQGGVEAQCLCQRPPYVLSQAILLKVDRRNRGIEAQCLCERTPSPPSPKEQV